MITTPIRQLLLFFFAVFAPWLMQASEAPLRVLIFSGQNNHDWKTTTPKLQKILTRSGRFAVEVTEHPEQCDAAALAKCDVILSNWNAWGKKSDAWPEPTRKAYIEAIRGGKGLVVVHAGSSSFYDWAEYQQAAGVSWKLGETHHGPPHEFTVKPVDSAHPVMRGMEPFRTKDELWEKPGVQPGVKILATSDDHPTAMTTEFGKGRTFALLLGHSAEFMENPGFQSLLLRGTEWAASGAVTLPALPVVNPEAVFAAVSKYHFGDERDSVLELERLVQSSCTDPAKKKDMAAKLLGLIHSSDATVDGKRQALWYLSLVASPEHAGALEKLAGDKDLGYFAQNALARISGPRVWKTEPELRKEGEATARVLTGAPGNLVTLLSGGDRKEQRRAIVALRASGDPAAIGAVAAEFEKLAPETQLQVVALLGDRPNPATLPVIAKATSSSDSLIRQAAFVALGQAGNAASVPVFVAGLGSATDEERKLIAESLSRVHGDGVDEAIVAALAKPPVEVQRELVRALVAREAKLAIPALMTAAGSRDAALRVEAGTAIGKLGDKSLCPSLVALLDKSPDVATLALASICRRENTVQPILDGMATAPAARKTQLIAVLGSTGGAQALAAIRTEMKGPDSPCRTAAIRALAGWSDAEAFDDLVALAGSSTDATSRILALRSISRLASLVGDRGAEKVVEKLAVLTANAGVNEKRALLGALAKVGSQAALKVVEGYANDPAVGAEAKAAAEQIKTAAKAKSSGRKRLGSATEAQMKLFDVPGNLCRGAKATSTTGLQPDGHGDVAAAAIDGDGGTYWDELDKQPLYAIRVQLAEPAKVGLVRILGFQHQNFAPKTFEILCDGKPVKRVEDAQYQDNVLSVELSPTDCSTVELKITGYYGGSPAIRELGIFAAPALAK